MLVTFTFYRRTNFRKHAYFWCACLFGMLYLVLNHSFCNNCSQNVSNLNPKQPLSKDRRLQPNCSFPNDEGLLSHQHANLTAFGLRLMEKSQPHQDETPKIPKRQILLVAYHRGGSTFLGEILNAYPGAFLHFEPLLLVSGNEQVRSRSKLNAALRLLKNIYRCRLGSLISTHPYWARSCLWYLEFNFPLVAGCPIRAQFCYSRAFLNAWCASHAIQIAKVLRLRLDHAKYLLHEFPDLRIIYLTRDPRGLYNSRRKWDWCNKTRSCIDPATYCENMRKDLAAAKMLLEKFPNRIIEISYHNLASDTENQVDMLLDFLELSRSAAVDQFIKMHTKHSKEGKEAKSLLTTYRDSKSRPFLWQKQLSNVEIARVEASCSDVIQHLGFNLTSLK